MGHAHALGEKPETTYSDLVSLFGSVLLHETLGSRGRHVRLGGRSFSRHIV
jgi:hypothetical protein